MQCSTRHTGCLQEKTQVRECGEEAPLRPHQPNCLQEQQHAVQSMKTISVRRHGRCKHSGWLEKNAKYIERNKRSTRSTVPTPGRVVRACRRQCHTAQSHSRTVIKASLAHATLQRAANNNLAALPKSMRT